MNIISKNALTGPAAALLLVALALQAPWWLVVPVACVLGIRAAKGWDPRKL